jgi:hypothetical protein
MILLTWVVFMKKVSVVLHGVPTDFVQILSIQQPKDVAIVLRLVEVFVVTQVLLALLVLVLIQVQGINFYNLMNESIF